MSENQTIEVPALLLAKLCVSYKAMLEEFRKQGLPITAPMQATLEEAIALFAAAQSDQPSTAETP